MKFDTREQWLKAAGNILIDEIMTPNTTVHAPCIVYSMTAPKSGSSTFTILGECWNRAASNDKHNAIFITTSLGAEESSLILATLLHEICHAYDDNQHGHGPEFQQLARNAGLVGGQKGRVKQSWLATKASPELEIHLKEIIETIGPIPNEAIKAELSGKKKQTNRQLLMHCTHCDFKFRASQKTIDNIKHHDCLCCDQGTLKQEQK